MAFQNDKTSIFVAFCEALNDHEKDKYLYQQPKFQNINIKFLFVKCLYNNFTTIKRDAVMGVLY